MAPGQTEQADETSILDDFELVRNGEGQWLLVLPAFPEIDDNTPVASRAELVDDELILIDGTERTLLQSLIAPHYAEALRADKPEALLLCMVDDEGNTRFIGKLPFRC
jgi:hypothetical protein